MRKLAVLALSAATLLLAGSAAAQPRGHDAGPRHVFVIMMENTGYDSLVGNPNAPWINSAIATYGVATHYFGVTHPSQPNYIAATAGITGPISDSAETLAVPNVVDQLESHGKTWKAYMQSYSLCADPRAPACGNQLYERKHNPFISYADVQSSPSRVAKIVDYSQLSADLAANAVPNYVWISPDQCNDMHGRFDPNPAKTDPCGFDHVQALIAAGDAFLKNAVQAIQASPAWTGNSVIYIAWDESDFTNAPGNFGFGDTSGCCGANPGGGHVLALVITSSNNINGPFDQPGNHSSLLRTIEDAWGLGCLGATCDRANVPNLNG
jgi:phosphatidylinositol-3-phosphatase